MRRCAFAIGVLVAAEATVFKSEIGNFFESPHVGCYAGEMRADSLRAVADERLRGFHIPMKRENFGALSPNLPSILK
jgi:hypothetical protein